MTEIVDLRMFAPVPVGHRVSIVPLETYTAPLFGGEGTWSAARFPLVCDETTRVIYTDAAIGLHPETTYEQIQFQTRETRISQSQAPLRGVVVACTALSDHGDHVHLRTILRVDTGPQLG